MSSFSRFSGNHQLALFVGADFPAETTGLPSRETIAREMANQHAIRGARALADVAGQVTRLTGRRYLAADFIRHAVDVPGAAPRPFHHRLASLVDELGIKTVFTTAYDNLIELALKEQGVAFNRILTTNDVHFCHPDRPTLIKLYGDTQRPESLVVTERDWREMLNDRCKEGLVDEMRRAFAHDTVLFMGFDVRSPDFGFLFDRMAPDHPGPSVYAVWSGRLAESEVRMWRDLGVVVLSKDPWGVIAGDAPVSSVSREFPPEPVEAVTLSTSQLTLVRKLGVKLSPESIPPPVTTKVQTLPFNELSWELFEALCAALVEAQPSTLDCHLYGVLGDDQQGIDIVATQRGRREDETWVYQCKRYKQYTPELLKHTLNKMVYKADYYVLMLSIPASAALRQVADYQAGFFLWDGKDIARKLKKYPGIVEDFFGPAWRQAFCG